MSRIRKVLAPLVLVLVLGVFSGWAGGFAPIASAEDAMGTPTPAVTTTPTPTPTPTPTEISVTAEAPTFFDECGLDVNLRVEVPQIDGVRYFIHWEGLTLQVDLHPAVAPYRLTNPDAHWEAVEDRAECEESSPSPTPASANPSGATTNPSTPAATSTATATSTSSSSASSSAQPTTGTGSPSTPTSVGPTAGGSSSTTPSTPGTTTKPTVKPSPPAPKPVVTTTTRATSWKAVKTNCGTGTVTQQRAITTTKTVDGKVVARATTFQTRVVGMTVTQKSRCPRMATVRVQVDLGAGNPDKKVNFRRKLVTCQAAYVDVANTRYLTRSVGRPLWKTRNCLYEVADVFTVKVKASLKGKARDRAIVTAVNRELGSQFRLGTRVPKAAKTTTTNGWVVSLWALRDSRVHESVWAGGAQRLLSSDFVKLSTAANNNAVAIVA